MALTFDLRSSVTAKPDLVVGCIFCVFLVILQKKTEPAYFVIGHNIYSAR